MATAPLGDDANTRVTGSQFIVTLGDADADGAATDHLDGKAAIFGTVVEGLEALERINAALIDDSGHPLVDLRIRHTVVLDDPFPDPRGLREPDASPGPTAAQLATVRIAEGEELREVATAEEAEAEEKRKREREARLQALTLEAMGDLPFAEVRPPENVLFVCKLNPVTTDEDLELIFSRFGKVLSCEVIRDRKSGDSLQYAFIEFEEKKSCEEAYFKMDQVLIDDRRIHVDFSQSVSKLSEVWRTETNHKRKKAAASGGGRGGKRGGWGGVDELEKWRKYREEYDDEEDRGKHYQMVHDEEDIARRQDEEAREGQQKKAQRPPPPERPKDADRERQRDRGDDCYGRNEGSRGSRGGRGGQRRSRSPRKDRRRENGRDGGRTDREDYDRPRDSGRDPDRASDRDRPRDRRDDQYMRR